MASYDNGGSSSTPFIPPPRPYTTQVHGQGHGHGQGVISNQNYYLSQPTVRQPQQSSANFLGISTKAWLILFGICVCAGVILVLWGTSKGGDKKNASKSDWDTPNNVPDGNWRLPPATVPPPYVPDRPYQPPPYRPPAYKPPATSSSSSPGDAAKDAVALLINSMDKTASPCEDFYQFACGGWNRDQSIKLKEEKGSNITQTTELAAMDKANVKLITKLIEQLPPPHPYLPPRTVPTMIRKFYSSCVRTKNLLFILDFLTKLANATSTQEPKAGVDHVNLHNANSNHANNYHNRPEAAVISGEIVSEEEIKEWDSVLKSLHPNPQELPEYMKFSLEYDEQDDMEARTTICTHFVRELLPEGVAKLFVTSHYLNDPLKDSKINDLIANIWNTFRTLTLYSAPWIESWDFESRMNMSRSIGGMSVVSGYLMDIMNTTGVEGHYKNVTLTDHFLLNLRELVGAREARKKAGGIMDVFNLEFYKDTTKATAFYMQILDTIFIPAGIVQVPAFHRSFPEILKYAKIGTTVAHEFAHSWHPYIEGIVLESPLLDEPITISDSVVSAKTRANYKQRSNCVVGQYNALAVPLPGASNTGLRLRVNGTLTVRENIADIAGMRIAFESWQENAGASFQPIPGLSEEFSKEQIFFIGAAQGRCHAYLDDATEDKLLREQVIKDVHSPNSIRVLGSLANFDEFAKAFSCPKGSTYNPVNKCTFFDS